MNLAELFIRRPVLASMLVALQVVLGVLAYRSLGVDLFPDVDLPVVTVVTTLRGASPEEMEAQVTKPIEEAVNTASGIDELRSSTSEGVSVVSVTFVFERNTSEAVQDVRDKVAAILGKLPEGTDPPVITRFDTDAIPVLTLVVSGPQSIKELTEYTDKVLREEVQVVKGVGQAMVYGGQKRAVNVWLDASKLSAHHLSVREVKAALIAQNVEIPTGRIDRDRSEQLLRTMARVERVPDFRDLVVSTAPDGRQLTLGELAVVEDGVEEPRSLARYEGRNAVALVVQKQSGTNTVEIVDRVNARLAKLAPTFPTGLKVEAVRDLSRFIRRSIHEVKLHLVLGAMLASVVVLLFMGNLRSTLIAALAIPTSIIATFAAMRLLGYTLNNMTLLGLVLAVGIVIDDAIVVLENVYRHIDDLGKDPFTAAIDGTREIMLAVVATTSSLIVIFLPIAFMDGRVGRFFKSFGITVAVAIFCSLVVAVTFTPMLCSKLLRPHRRGAHGERPVAEHEGGTWINRVLHRGYGALVLASLRHKWLVVLLAAGCVGSVLPLFETVGKDFVPIDDRSEFLVDVTVPPGATLARTDEHVRRIEEELRGLPHVRHLFTLVGSGGDVTNGTIFVQLDDLDLREKDGLTQAKIMGLARKLLGAHPELRTAVIPVNDLGGGGGGGFQFNYALQGGDMQKLEAIAAEVIAKMRRVPGLVDVDTTTAQRTPELRVLIDRKKAADLGVRAADIAQALRTLVAGEQVTKFREGAEQFDVWLRLRREDRAHESALERIEIPSASGALVPLGALVHLRDDTGPSEIERLNRQRQVTLVANLDKLPLDTAIQRTTAFIQEADLPPGYAAVPIGRAKVFQDTIRNFAVAFGLALIFMYMILAAQFESFLHPVTIMLALPLTVPFALLSLVGLDETLNLYSVIGVFMLFGIVKKNGILQVDYTTTLRREGVPRDEAIHRANVVRLRPILMTTVTLVAGMIPIALGKGPGAASRASMAKAIIGGQVLSLLISLLIVPVGYALFDDATRFLTVDVPAALRARRAFAYAIVVAGLLLSAAALVAVIGLFAELPPLAVTVEQGLAVAGAALVISGAIVRRLGR